MNPFNQTNDKTQLLSEGMVYGGGMFKLEPKELANVDASVIAELIPDLQVEEKAE